MICNTCRYKKECDFYEKIEIISNMVEEMLLDDEEYANRILETINSLSKCDEFDETVNISKKRYQILSVIEKLYEKSLNFTDYAPLDRDYTKEELVAVYKKILQDISQSTK